MLSKWSNSIGHVCRVFSLQELLSVSAGDQVMDEFHHIVAKPWIERLKRVDPDTQKAFDLDRQVRAAHISCAPNCEFVGCPGNCAHPFARTTY